MSLKSFTSIKILLALMLVISTQVFAKEYFVDSKEAYKKISSKLKAGDKVILKNGTYIDFEILFRGEGEQDKPISLSAETKGKVMLSGQSNLRLAGKHLVVSGLVFKNGFTPSSSVIEFRQNKKNFAYHSRVTEVVIDNFNNPDKQESDYWVAFHGKHNRLDHSHIVGKRNKGVTIAVRLNDERSQENYHIIDHNYFGYRPVFGSNGGETLRIGTSHYSLTDSFTKVENNFFEHTNGEVEIISIKSGKNTLKGNVFFEARGTLTMRHGNGNIIEENIFFGNGVEHTGGIRVINKDQVIRNNYLEGLTGYRFGSGFTVLNGVPNSPINRYHQVDNALIENNTFINVKHMQLAAGSDAERSAVPINSAMKNNLIINQDQVQPFTIFDDVSGIKFSGNVANTDTLKDVNYGIENQALKLERAKNGLLYPSKQINAGAKRDLLVIAKEDTGVSWYPKRPANVAFGSGKTHPIAAKSSVFVDAINKAASGDVIELDAGHFVVPKIIQIDKTLSIKAKTPSKTKITFERSSLFEILDGGSLLLDGLHISGADSPDSAGNSLIRTRKWGMLYNYRIVATNNVFADLDINHSFHFFVTGKGAFADQITLSGNRFSKVSGDILRLDSEIEDLGIYNAEYVTLNNNKFTDVSGALVKLYRGGTDESTFGPHLAMANNYISNLGLGKRNNKTASVFLHGVQVASINNNTFKNTAPVVIEHTVGEPKTVVSNNTFDGTPAPSIVELRVEGPHTAVLENNQVK